MKILPRNAVPPSVFLYFPCILPLRLFLFAPVTPLFACVSCSKTNKGAPFLGPPLEKQNNYINTEGGFGGANPGRLFAAAGGDADWMGRWANERYQEEVQRARDGAEGTGNNDSP